MLCSLSFSAENREIDFFLYIYCKCYSNYFFTLIPQIFLFCDIVQLAVKLEEKAIQFCLYSNKSYITLHSDLNVIHRVSIALIIFQVKAE